VVGEVHRHLRYAGLFQPPANRLNGAQSARFSRTATSFADIQRNPGSQIIATERKITSCYVAERWWDNREN
jgi:hypothetical protein